MERDGLTMKKVYSDSSLIQLIILFSLLLKEDNRTGLIAFFR